MSKQSGQDVESQHRLMVFCALNTLLPSAVYKPLAGYQERERERKEMARINLSQNVWKLRSRRLLKPVLMYIYIHCSLPMSCLSVSSGILVMWTVRNWGRCLQGGRSGTQPRAGSTLLTTTTERHSSRTRGSPPTSTSSSSECCLRHVRRYSFNISSSDCGSNCNADRRFIWMRSFFYSFRITVT